jgi:hypothetical protein
MLLRICSPVKESADQDTAHVRPQIGLKGSLNPAFGIFLVSSPDHSFEDFNLVRPMNDDIAMAGFCCLIPSVSYLVVSITSL